MYAGQYQPEAAIFLSELNVPAYVSVVGKARKYEPEDGSVYTSIRPEELNYADEILRDRWVLDTAERTLERIRIMEDALSSKLSGNELKDYLLKKGTNAVLADGAVRAIGHYKNLDRFLSELKNALVRAVEMVLSEIVKTGTPEKEKRQEQKASEEASNLQSGASTYVQPAGEHSTYEKINEKIEPKEVLAGIIDKLDTGKGIPYAW